MRRAWRRGDDPRSLALRIGPWDRTVLPAAQRAVESDAAARRTEVTALLDELVAMGRRSGRVSAPVGADEHALT
jgi:hypothetical protein